MHPEQLEGKLRLTCLYSRELILRLLLSRHSECTQPLNQTGHICALLIRSSDLALQRAHAVQSFEEQTDQLRRDRPFPAPHLMKQMLQMMRDLLQPVVAHRGRGALKGMGRPEELLDSVCGLSSLLQSEHLILDQLQLVLQLLQKNPSVFR